MPKNYHKVESSFQVYFFVCVSLMCLINFGLGLLRTLIRISVSVSLVFPTSNLLCYAKLPRHLLPSYLLLLLQFFLPSLFSLYFVVYLCQFHVYVYHLPGSFFFLPCFLANSHLLALPLPPPAAVGFNVLEFHLNISLCEKERNKRGGQQLKIDSKLAWHFQLHLKSICY